MIVTSSSITSEIFNFVDTQMLRKYAEVISVVALASLTALAAFLVNYASVPLFYVAVPYLMLSGLTIFFYVHIKNLTIKITLNEVKEPPKVASIPPNVRRPHRRHYDGKNECFSSLASHRIAVMTSRPPFVPTLCPYKEGQYF